MRARRTGLNQGFTLVEMLLVVALFSVLFAALMTVVTSSDRSWKTGQSKLTQQQEARKAMGQIVRLLRQSNADWIVDGVHYPVSISTGSRIDFYVPSFTDDGEISSLRKVTFKPDLSDSTRLVKKEGVADSVVVATYIKDIAFTQNGSQLTVQITTEKDQEFTLSSEVTLRNQNTVVADDVEIIQPEEGEF